MPSPAATETGTAASSKRRPRGAVVALLCALAAALGSAAFSRAHRGGASGAVAELADGDLDGAARRIALHQVLAASNFPEATAAQLSLGLLAALALGAEREHTQLAARLGIGSGPPRWPTDGGPPSWSLGDPMLANATRALAAEARAERAEAVRWWRQVAAQARLGGAGFVAGVAAAAIQRLS